MKLNVFNGSPRGKNSNSSVIIKWLEEGVSAFEDSTVEIYYLNKIKEHDAYVNEFGNSECNVMIFPLYTDCMPGIVMAFIEKLASLQDSLAGKKLGFIVHSGFPEAAHSRYVERYLASLCGKLGVEYMGTAVLGGSEGFRMMPETMTKGKRLVFTALGKDIVRFGKFQPETLEKIAGREKLTKPMLFMFRIGSWFGLTNKYWDYLLKKNNAFDKRFARPYI